MILKNLREFVNSNKILSAILGVNLLIHGIGITWGLPNFDSWAIDAVVPSGVLKGLAKGFSFGFVYHYPMAHLVILSILILPILIIGAIHALVLHSPSEIKVLVAKTKTLPPLEQWELVQTILPIKYYTSAIILIGNIVSLFMSIGIVYFTYKIVKEIFDEKKALFSAALLTFNASFNYYSHTANLDVPYIFWGLFALYHLVLAVKYNKK
ncbi:MAG TPA: glycosyltransferase family 39 protein, partial [Spirochaetota bacterium]|nr:glycosyltransferase family 39 protein [Spirochaetota bacterium]